MGRVSRLLCWILVVLLLGGVVIGLSFEVHGVGSARYTVEVIGENPSPVRRATCVWCGRQGEAASILNSPVETILADSEKADELTDRSFVVSQLTTSRETAFSLTYTYRRWGVVLVELADDTRRARVLEFPDPRTRPRTVVFRLDDESRPQGDAR
jgi:hypothetical protein